MVKKDTKVEVEKVEASDKSARPSSNSRVIDAQIVESSSAETQKPEEKKNYGYSVKLSSGISPQGKETASSPAQAPSPVTEGASVKLSTADLAAQPITNLAAKPHKHHLPAKNVVTKLVKGSVIAIDSFAKLVVGQDSPGMNEVIKKAKPPIVFGIWVIIVTFLIGGLWSGLAPLDRASHAQGFVVSDSKKQIIQHREGGILEELYVKEGQEVKKDELLARLNDTEIKSALESAKIQKASAEKQLELNKEQLEALEGVHKQGFIARAKIIEAQIQQSQVISHIGELNSRIITLEDKLTRLSISSPVDGVVNQIQLHTKGAAIAPGATLMTITPRNENLVIEAYVSPNDIDLVHIGLKSKIRISAFKHRSTGPLEGVVTFVSSDVVEPSQTQHYSQEGMLAQRAGLSYKVRIEVDRAQLKTISKYRDYELTPGMTADVTIVTGERTLLQYLLDPITTTFWHAFKEQ